MLAAPAIAARPAPRATVRYNVTASAWSPGDAAIKASGIDQTFVSSILGQTVSISVMVPSDYDSSGLDYPVVWHLHGLSTAGGSAPNNRYAATWYPQVYGNAVRDQLVRPHITVFVNGLNYSMWMDDDQGAMLVERYVMLEALPWVQANYRTLTAAQYNVTAGFSMGFRGALYLALKYPETFGGSAGYGAPLYASDADFAARSDVDDWGPYILSPTEAYTAAERARWQECSPQGWLTRNSVKPKLRINYGATDTLTSGLNVTFLALLTSNGIAHVAGTPVPGVAHSASGTWGSADGQLAMAWIESVFAGAA